MEHRFEGLSVPGANGLVALLGAGFSRWAAGLPLASELFDFAVQSFGRTEPVRLARLRGLKEEWDAERPGGHAEEFVAYVLRERPDHAGELRWYIGRRLSEPFIWTERHAGRWRRQSFMIDEHRAPKLGLSILGPIRSAGCIGVLTTNYDMVLEYALTSRGFNYGVVGQMLDGRGPYPASRPSPLTGRLPISKLHGSLSWDAQRMYSEGRCGVTGKALIVPPSPEKEPPQELGYQWEMAGDILSRGRRLVVFGFSFNSYDQALLQLLQRNGTSVESVLIVDVADLRERAAPLFPRASLSLARPPPEGMPCIEAWLRAERPSDG
jgi:hypothetical protein